MPNSQAVDGVCAVLRENAVQVDAEAKWPQASLQAISDAGLLATKDLSMRQFADMTRRFSQSCTSTAMIYLMHVCAAKLVEAGPNATLAQQITAEKALTTLAFSEKGSRSHFWAPVSRAHQNGRGILIDADKSFVTSAGRADYYVVSTGSINRCSTQ